jgi:hypothetical protein
MSTATMNGRSAYPLQVAELLPRAQRLAADLGEMPSQNRLKAELRIGVEKARAVRAALAADTEPPAEDAAPEPAAVVPEPVTPIESDAPEPEPAALLEPATVEPSRLAAQPVGPGATGQVTSARLVHSWPLLVLAQPAFVAIWSGWVGLGGLTGFGIVHPLPGIWDRFSLNTAITLPVGVETYAAYALRAWLSPHAAGPARRFAKWSAIGSLMLGAAGQVAYHLMAAAHIGHAPWEITTLVAALPVAVLGMGAALAHLLHRATSE